MKQSLLVLTLMLSLHVLAQKNDYTWPIAGKQAGEDILFQPEGLIDNEVNKSDLFIGGELHAPIIAPEGGVITYLRLCELNSLKRITSYKYYCPKTGKTSTRSTMPAAVTYTISIQAKNGIKYHLTGLDSINTFVTGDRVKKGDVLGELGYAYSKIAGPNLRVSISKGGKNADPMQPFGLESTYIPYVPDNTNYTSHKHSVEVLNEDYTIFRSALEEGHPGLYDFITKDSLDAMFDRIEAKLNKPMTSQQFLNKIRPVIKAIRDSHTSIKLNAKINNTCATPKMSFLPILFCLQNDSLIIHSTTEKHEDFFGKSIISIDGVPKDSIIKNTKCHAYGRVYGNIESMKNRYRHSSFSSFYQKSYPKKRGTEVPIVFADSTLLTMRYGNFKPGLYDVLSKRRGERQKEQKQSFRTSIVSDSIAIIDINTFTLLDTEVSDIKLFILSLKDSSIQNLVIDLRRNSGGSSQVMNDIYSYIAKHSYQVEVGEKVNKKGTYDFFEHTFNFGGTKASFGEDHYPIEGKSGYYKTAKDMPFFQPDSNAYSEKVFVLIDQNSQSAASVFTGLVHKYKRGLVIGRETGSVYHRLNATTFARLNLSNTKIEVRIPLIQTMYDDPETSDIPWGRGVLPDCEIPTTYQERIQENDVFLEQALKVIRAYKPEVEEVVEVPEDREYTWVIVGLAFLLLTLILFKSKKKR